MATGEVIFKMEVMEDGEMVVYDPNGKEVPTTKELGLVPEVNLDEVKAQSLMTTFYTYNGKRCRIVCSPTR